MERLSIRLSVTMIRGLAFQTLVVRRASTLKCPNTLIVLVGAAISFFTLLLDETKTVVFLKSLLQFEWVDKNTA